MNKFVFKATALAIGALVGGGAFASVNFSVDPVAVTGKFAKELDYSKATGTAISANKAVVTKLGFGVSGSQNRYIRVDVGGLKLQAVAAGANVVATGTNFANVTVVAGGAVDDSYIIYQVTGDAGGHAASQLVTITLPNMFTTAGNAASPTVTYSLYETAVAAVNNTAGTSLYSNSGTLFTFAEGLKWKLTTAENTAAVADLYKKFDANSLSSTLAKIGTFDYGVNAGVSAAGGGAVALTDLVTAATKITFTGDFAATGTGSLGHDAVGNACAAPTAITLNTAMNSGSVTVGTTNTNRELCWSVEGKVAIPVQDIKADLVPVAAAGTTTADPVAAVIGSILHDGTTLQAPFATIHPDYLSRVVLTSEHSSDAAVAATVITEDGVTCPTVNGAYTIKAGKQLIINTKAICPALSTGGTRLAVKLIIAAPNNTISGVYNVMNYNQTTGATDSLISYPLLRPGTN